MTGSGRLDPVPISHIEKAGRSAKIPPESDT